MVARDLKALYARIIEAFNERDLPTLEAMMHKDVVNHAPMPGEPRGIEGLRHRFGVMRQAFPDFRFTTEVLIAEGDRTAARGVMTGTHTGPFMGMPATGKGVRVAYLDILRFVDGRMSDHWGAMDVMGMMQQLGMVSAR